MNLQVRTFGLSGLDVTAEYIFANLPAAMQVWQAIGPDGLPRPEQLPLDQNLPPPICCQMTLCPAEILRVFIPDVLPAALPLRRTRPSLSGMLSSRSSGSSISPPSRTARSMISARWCATS